MSASATSVLITGTSSGLGRATALRLSRRGLRVYAGVRDEADASSLRDEAAGSGVPVETVRMDVTDPESIAQAVAHLDETIGGGRLIGVVNNAGEGYPGPLEVLPIEDFRAQLEVNVIGQLAVAQALLPRLRRDGGRLIFVGSLGGKVAFPYAGAYHASKYAIEAVGEAMRKELGPTGVEVIVIEPGPTESEIWQKAARRTNDVLAELPAGAPPHYREELERFEERMGDADANAMPADAVAQTIERALTEDSPSARYPVGLQAKILTRARELVPDRLFDRLASLPFRS